MDDQQNKRQKNYRLLLAIFVMAGVVSFSYGFRSMIGYGVQVRASGDTGNQSKLKVISDKPTTQLEDSQPLVVIAENKINDILAASSKESAPSPKEIESISAVVADALLESPPIELLPPPRLLSRDIEDFFDF